MSDFVFVDISVLDKPRYFIVSREDLRNILSSVIVETIINQNEEFSLREGIPLVGSMEAARAFNIFSELFKLAIETIGIINKKFKIKDL